MGFRVLSVLCLPLVVYGGIFKERLYEQLEFGEDDRAKVLILDQQMQLLDVIDIKKGQKDLDINLQDSQGRFLIFTENPKTIPNAQDSKYLKAQALPEDVPEEERLSRYEARFERNRFLGDFLGFEPHKFNYILPANMSFGAKQGHAKNTEVKFQLSVRKMLIDDLFVKDLDLYFAYTQQSFWQIYDDENSRPFRESNYEPSLYFSYSLEQYSAFLDRINFGYMHQSNGGDLSKSRSWERLFIEGIYSYKSFAIGLKTWYRIEESPSRDDNPDILKYLGYGELSLGYAMNKHLFMVTLRNNLRFSDNRGSVVFDYSYPIYRNFYVYMQYFSGYGESLIDYNRAIERLGIGFLFAR